ncbi:MAG: NAD-dependent epimerase/dehydratase family protein [Actinomycetota bacterium]|nr:NAD-dependent epimerase/dehydratase family protein [Actinomycetota bacterium]
MRVAVTGATGNVGTSLVETLSADPDVSEIVGIARRRPELVLPKTKWVTVDVTSPEIGEFLDGIDVVVHLAWLIQPSRNLAELSLVNVEGSRNLFEAAAGAGVSAIVYASSVGAYSPGPKDRLVDESWPVEGIETAFYSRHKAEVERILSEFEERHRDIRVVRLRPALIFKGEAATGVRRLFAGPLLPGKMLRRPFIPAVPDDERLIFQAVHCYDVAEAYRLAVTKQVSGAFNVAADPVLDMSIVANVLGPGRTFQINPRLLRGATTLAWKLRLQPTPPGWVDLALKAPLLDSSRAHEELGWTPRRSSIDALEDLINGLRTGRDFPTPPLAGKTTSPLRWKELATGVGTRGSYAGFGRSNTKEL